MLVFNVHDTSTAYHICKIKVYARETCEIISNTQFFVAAFTECDGGILESVDFGFVAFMISRLFQQYVCNLIVSPFMLAH